ncbi:MinD/ParA family protein [Rhodospirillaceae bacterium KN72]|uniref:MinD/ParA family protein n=1 Tax=Pacificispira spongiicola TaxID=2729598 RepID=A0A7Y0E353_9PROT|nr:cellulose synthase operon protein YhjQ/BcsQ [Pacificispira spongiicola]NMM46362.1 MinD/ParA family protein [Pacificispira spongiicola]
MNAQAPNNNLIAIASGKGGVGKTWFAITLAQALARSGRKVLLFDGDLGLANIDIQLGLTPERDLALAIAGKLRMTQCVEKFAAGPFDIIAGRSGSGSLASLPTPRIERIGRELVALAGGYQHVLIDLGAGVDKTVQMLAATASRTLLLVNDEPTSLTDGYAFIKLGWTNHPGMDIRIVVNGAESQAAGQKTYDILSRSCENFLKRKPPLAGIVRRDNRVRDAIRAQQPLLTRSPTSEAASDVEAIARSLL